MKMNKNIAAFLFCLISIAGNAQNEDWVGRNWVGRDEFVNSPGGFVAGYTNNQFRYHLDDGNTYGSFKGSEKFLHGWYAGFVFEINCFRGVGIYLGSMVENLYALGGEFSTSNGKYTDYKEWAVYSPVHLQFKMPLNRHDAVGIHAGVGVTRIVSSAFTDSKGYLKETDAYDEYGMKKTQISFDWGVYLQMRKIRMDVAWQYGLTELVENVYKNGFRVGFDFLF